MLCRWRVNSFGIASREVDRAGMTKPDYQEYLKSERWATLRETYGPR